MTITDQKTKITFVLPSLIAGGAERVLITLANGTDSNKYDKTFVIVSEQGTLRDLISKDIPVKSLGGQSVFKSLPKLYKALKHEKPEIIVSTMAHMNFAVLMLRPFFPRTKFIVREAITPSFLLKKYKRLGIIIKCMYKLLYRQADLILSPSKIILDELKTELKLSNLSTKLLNNSVNEDAIRAQIKWPVKKNRNIIKFVAAGRLHYQKGFDRLIEAASTLNMPYDWHIDILGEGSEYENIRNLIVKYGLEDSVTLKGLVDIPYSDFAAADCFLLPSRFEGLPNVALEALACGTRVISMFEAGGIAEIKANDQDLKIVNTMDEFKSEMQRIKPSMKTKAAPSLLPKENTYDKVIACFNDILLEYNSLD